MFAQQQQQQQPQQQPQRVIEKDVSNDISLTCINPSHHGDHDIQSTTV